MLEMLGSVPNDQWLTYSPTTLNLHQVGIVTLKTPREVAAELGVDES